MFGREEERLQRAQPAVEAMMKRVDSDDSLVEYGEGGEMQFEEDGSFIGQYTGTRRDVRDLDFSGGLELRSPMNTIYSLAWSLNCTMTNLKIWGSACIFSKDKDKKRPAQRPLKKSSIEMFFLTLWNKNVFLYNLCLQVLSPCSLINLVERCLLSAVRDRQIFSYHVDKSR